MADSDDINVKFGASTGPLESGVNTAKSKIGELASVISPLAGKFGELAGAIVGAFSIDKISEFVSHMGEAAEQIESLSTISGLSGETIQTLQFAMKMTGGSADMAAQMLIRFNKSVEEAAAGTGKSYDAFQKLGVSLSDLQHKDMDSLFKETLDGFKNIHDTAEAAEVGTALLSRGFKNIAAVAHQGSAGLVVFKNELKEDGTLMDKTTTENFAMMEKGFIRLGDAAKGVGITLLNDMGSAIRSVTDWLTGLINQVNVFLRLAGIAGGEIQKWSGGAASLPKASANNADMEAQWNKALGGATGASADIGSGEVTNRNASGQADTAKTNADAQQKADDEAAKSQSEFLQESRSNYAEQYSVKKEYDELQVASGTMSHDQMYADLQQELNKEHALTDQSFQDQMALYYEDSDEYQKALAQKGISDQKYQIESMKLQQDQAKESTKTWDSAFSTIEKSFDTMLSGILQGTQTMGQAFQKMAQNLVLSLGNALIKMGLDWVKTEAQKEYATLTANAAIQTSNTTTAAQSSTASKPAASESIMQDAGKAAAAVYADVAEIPYVGWILAPPAAAAAFAAVTAFDSFDKGTPYVPNDMTAKIHQGEIIVPAAQSADIRAGRASLGGGGGGVHFNVSAMDAKGVKQFFAQHGDTLAKALSNHYRGGSRSLLNNL